MKRVDPIAGFSLVELVISVALMSTATLMLVSLLQKPVAIQGYITAADQERLVSNTMDIMVNDLVEADPASINWPAIYPNASANINGITVSKTTYNDALPTE